MRHSMSTALRFSIVRAACVVSALLVGGACEPPNPERRPTDSAAGITGVNERFTQASVDRGKKQVIDLPKVVPIRVYQARHFSRDS